MIRPILTLLCGLTLALSVLTINVQAQDEAAKAESKLVLKGLVNPSSVSFSPEGDLTVCDARGKVVVLQGKQPVNFIVGFDTEYWKKDDSGKQWYGVGPLSAIWMGETLVVTDAGKGDGEETVLFFDKAGKAADGTATNSVPPTTDDEADKGEGNLTGLSADAEGKNVYVCGQGFDGKSWVLKVDVPSKKMEPLLSADENGIETNSPMQTIVGEDNSLWVLYSGKGGAEDGLIVKWDLETKKPAEQWKLPGLVNPMGMALIEDNKFAVVENNWSLTEVNQGSVAVVTLGDDGEATVEETGVELQGPVACAFGPDDKLYVCNLGEEFDAPNGTVVAVSGLK